MTYQDWYARYLEPMIAMVHANAEPTDEMTSGFAGLVLDGILAVKDIDGQEMNDWECVELVEELIRYARSVENRVEAAVQ